MHDNAPPPLTPRQEYVASICGACDDNFTCPRAYAEGCSYLQHLIGALEL